MKLLHTSDWHIGRTLEKNSLEDAHALYFDHLVEIVQEHNVDALLVSGDVYDRALPSAESIAVLDSVLRRLVPLTKVIITSGNHDSAQRLGFNGHFTELAGLHYRTTIEGIARPVLLEKDGETVAVYGIPYLEPATSLAAVMELCGTTEKPESATHQSVLKIVLDFIREHAQHNGYANTVIMSHAWFAGAAGSESERTIAVGGLENVPLDYLDGFTYAALGHIHKPHDLRPHVHYSGSPIKFSFSEINQTKVSLLVDIADGLNSVTKIETPVFREMVHLEGTLEDLLTNEAHEPYTGHWVRAKLTMNELPAHAMDNLRQRFPFILKLELPQVGTEVGKLQNVHEMSPEDFCCGFLDFARGETRPVTDWEREQIHAAAAAVSVAEVAQ